MLINKEQQIEQSHVSRAQVIYSKPLMLAAVQTKGPYSRSADEAWKQIFNWLDKLKPDPFPSVGYSLYYHDPRLVKESELRYAAGIPAPRNWQASRNDGVFPLQFAGGTFMKRTVVGPYTNLGRVMSELRNQWIPENGLVLDQSQPAVSIHHSDQRFVDPAKQTADVCLPVFADRRSKPRA